MAADELLHPAARAELHDAVLWYREHAGAAAAAVAFVVAVTTAIEQIARAPQRWPALRNVAPPVRYRVLPKYPYTVFYRELSASVLVVAVAHQKRQPLYWTSRR